MSRFSRIGGRNFVLAFIVLSVVFIASSLVRSHAQVFTRAVTVVSAATFEEAAVAPNSIAVAFTVGTGVPNASAQGLPLPTTLGGLQVRLTDSAGVNRECGLFFVSSTQVNFLVPPEAASGVATIAITGATIVTQTGTIEIAAAAPGIFTANANGQGAPAGFLLSVPDQGGQSYESLFVLNQRQDAFVARPVLLDRQPFQAERLFFILFGTGFPATGATVTAQIGGVAVNASFAGPIPGFAGLDQINIPIDAAMVRELTGRGRVNLALTATTASGGTLASNVAEIEIADRQGPAPPIITSIEPTRALARETVTIKGENLFTAAGPNRVRVGGVEAQITEATATELKIIVPFGAESGPIKVSSGGGETASQQTLTVRTSISGMVEDTRRRPVAGATIRVFSYEQGTPSVSPLITTTTNVEGVFLAAVPSTDKPVMVEIDARTASVSPALPRIRLFPALTVEKDNFIPRPIALQLSSGIGIKFNQDGRQALGSSVSALAPWTPPSFEHDWTGRQAFDSAIDTTADLTQQSCGGSFGLISFQGSVNIPCETAEDCLAPTRTLYFSSIENSRTPVSLPVGIFSAAIYQFAPYETTFQSGVSLGLPNIDCLPSGAARVYKFQPNSSGLSLLPTSDRFVEIGAATVSPDGQGVSISGSILTEGGIFFVAVKRRTATIIGRVVAPDPTGFEGAGAPFPVRRAVVTARGQQAMTDGAGFFVLRNVPVLRTNDTVAPEVSYLRSTGRIERLIGPNLQISENAVISGGVLRLGAANVNRQPVILAASSLALAANERLDRNLSITEADANQTLQASMTGPAFASLINRGDGRYTLRLTPGPTDIGSYTINVRAVDNLGLISIAPINVQVTGDAVNQPPTADPQSITTEEDKAVSISLTGKDPNGNALSFQVLTQPTHGRLSGVAPDLTFTPDANYFGPDSFTFKVNDGASDSPPATVSITVTPINDAPLFVPPGEQKVAVGSELRFTVSATDADPADQLTITSSDLPLGATLTPLSIPSGSGMEFRWTPGQDQTGAFILTFRVTDNGATPLTATRTVAITVTTPAAPSEAAIWTPASGPSGGSVGAIFANGTVVLAGAYRGGVYRSTDNGETWTPTGVGVFGQDPVITFGSVGTSIIANTSFGLYRSTDNGLTWAIPTIELQGTVGLLGRPPAAFTVKGSIAFTTYLGFLLSSSDGGANWTPVNQGLPQGTSISALAASGSSLFVATSYGLMYRSDDDGKSYTLSGQGLPSNQSINRLYANQGSLFAIVQSVAGPAPVTAIYESSNNGGDWRRLDSPVGSAVTSMLFTDDQWLAVVWGQFDFIGMRVYSFVRRPDRTLAATQLYEARYLSALAAGGSSLFTATLGDGVVRSTDKGAGWKAINTGLNALSIYSISSVGGNAYAATTDGVYLSEDQGKTWRAVNAGLGNQSTLLFLEPGWISPSVPPREITSIASVESGGETVLFAAQTPRILNRSRDLGKTWEPVAPPSLTINRPISILFGTGSTIFVASAAFVTGPQTMDSVFRSSDFGATWTLASAGLPSASPQAFASIGASLFVAAGDRVYLSTNGGGNWNSLPAGWPSNVQVTTLAVRGTTLYAGTFGAGLFASTNNGQSWTPADAGLPAYAIITELYASGSNLVLISPTEYGQVCPNGGVIINGRCFGGIIPGSNPPGLRPNFLLRAAGRVYFSPNQGAAWAPVGAGLSDNVLTAVGGLGNVVLVGARSGGIFLREF